MTTAPAALRQLAACLAIGVSAVATLGASPQRDVTPDDAALRVFSERAEAYAVMHRGLAASLPALGPRLDRRTLLISRTFLASAIRAARPNPRQGDILTPAAARIVRNVLADAVDEGDLGTFVSPMDEEGRMLSGIHPRLYDPFPAWETIELPASVLYRLPTLPAELEYRIVDFDLVLWDVYADLIVDVLPYAIAHPASDGIYR